MIMSAEAMGLQSRFTPMPANLHIGFCVFATVVFLIIFLRRKTVSSLIWALICDSTVILQFYNDPQTALAVGICVVLLFAILICVCIREKKEHKLLEAAEAQNETEKNEESEPDDRHDIEKLVRTEMQNIADSGNNDIIGNAFEDDKL